MSPTTPEGLRQRLAEIDAEVQALASDDFAKKYALMSEADGYRASLEDHDAPALEAAAKQWAERAGRKGAHTQDAEALKAMVVSQTAGTAGH